MNSVYIKGWGIPIGTFDENELKENKDKKVLEEYQKEFPQYGYTNTKIVKEHGVRKLAIYICSVEDMRLI